jgi:uncharacterized tellurite resistance protein B-like protein
VQGPPLTAASVVPRIGRGELRVAADQALADPQLMAATQSAFSACGLVFAMLIADDPVTQRLQASAILKHAGPALLREAQRLHPRSKLSARSDRLTLLTLAAPALRALSRVQRQSLRRTISALIAADGATTAFEHLLGYMLAELWTRRNGGRSSTGHAGLSALQAEAQLVLSALSHLGATSADAAQAAFVSATERLPGLSLSLLPASPRLLAGLPAALDRLHSLRPTARAALVDACAHAVLADQRVSDDELTVLRALCLALEAPLPPLAEPAAAISATTQHTLERHSAAE